MKQRVTFIQPEGTGIDPNGIYVNPDTVVFSNARSAALQKQLTLALEDLPAEVCIYGTVVMYSVMANIIVLGHCNFRTMP